MIAEDVRLGENVVIYHHDLVNLYGCEIGDGCKVGAFVGAFALPVLLHWYGLNIIMGILAIACIAGCLLTQLLPEMAGQKLEQTEQ